MLTLANVSPSDPNNLNYPLSSGSPSCDAHKSFSPELRLRGSSLSHSRQTDATTFLYTGAGTRTPVDGRHLLAVYRIVFIFHKVCCSDVFILVVRHRLIDPPHRAFVTLTCCTPHIHHLAKSMWTLAATAFSDLNQQLSTWGS